MYKLLLFFVILAVISFIGLIPTLISEEKLHNMVYNLYHNSKSNLEVILGELQEKNYLIEEQVSNENYVGVDSCNSTFYFVEPVTIIFDIDSKFENCSTYKEFYDVECLTVFSLNGDIECHVSKKGNSKSIFLFSDTHRLKLVIRAGD